MIKINLLGDDTALDRSGVLFVTAFAASVVVVGVVCFFLLQAVNGKIETAQGEISSLEKRLAALQETTKEVRDLEKKRKELNDKLAVIARLKKSKAGPVHVMDDLNMALPERAWLTGVKEKQNQLSISGYALDNQTIASFMKELERSDYYDTIDLVETKQATRKGTKLKSFKLNAKIRYTGKLLIDESVVGEKDAGKKQRS